MTGSCSVTCGARRRDWRDSDGGGHGSRRGLGKRICFVTRSNYWAAIPHFVLSSHMRQRRNRQCSRAGRSTAHTHRHTHTDTHKHTNTHPPTPTPTHTNCVCVSPDRRRVIGSLMVIGRIGKGQHLVRKRQIKRSTLTAISDNLLNC